jgi:hypothetical protein
MIENSLADYTPLILQLRLPSILDPVFRPTPAPLYDKQSIIVAFPPTHIRPEPAKMLGWRAGALFAGYLVINTIWSFPK